MLLQEGAARGELPADLEAALMAGRLPLEVLRAYLRLASVPVLGALCRAFPGEGRRKLYACRHGQHHILLFVDRDCCSPTSKQCTCCRVFHYPRTSMLSMKGETGCGAG